MRRVNANYGQRQCNRQRECSSLVMHQPMSDDRNPGRIESAIKSNMDTRTCETTETISTNNAQRIEYHLTHTKTRQVARLLLIFPVRFDFHARLRVVYSRQIDSQKQTNRYNSIHTN
jgi:hypothetical protein